MVVSEQAAADLQRFLIQRLGLGVLPQKPKVARDVLVNVGGLRVVVGEQAAADLQCLLTQRLGRGIPALIGEVARELVVALGGIGVVVSEQAAVELQRVLQQRLGLGILPLNNEDDPQVAVAVGCFGMVVGEQAAANLEHLLEQRLGLGKPPFGVMDFRRPIQGNGRLVGESILVLRGHPAQRHETPFRIHGLKVLRPLSPCPQRQKFLRPSNRLVPAVGLQCPLNGLGQVFRPLGIVAGQLPQPRCWWLCVLRCRRLGDGGGD